MSLPHPGMAHRRNLFEQSVFDESYKIVGDWDFLARVLPKRGHYAVGSVQACMVLGGKSNHASTVSAQYREVMRSLNARNVGMPIKMKLYWLLKRWAPPSRHFTNGCSFATGRYRHSSACIKSVMAIVLRWLQSSTRSVPNVKRIQPYRK